MGEEITGSAVIQHLAKTRARMVARGLEVPPPLRRGGGSSRMPLTGTTLATTTAAATNKSNLKAKPNAKSAPRKAKKATKKGNTPSDDSDSDDGWKDDDSDAEYGQPAAKRAKTTKGPMKRKIKTEDSDDEVIPPSKATKRKATDFKPSEERSAFGHTDINGVPIDDDTETEGEGDNERVGTGQPWLDLDDDQETKNSPAKKSLVVSLPTTPVKTDVFQAGDHENHVIGDVQTGFENYQVEDHQAFNNPIANDFTTGFVTTNGYGGGYGNDGGYDANISETFGTNMTGGSTISNAYNLGGNSMPDAYSSAGASTDAYNFGNGNTVPYPIQTSWPDYQGSIGSYSHYTSLTQTPATTSAGPDLNGGYFGNNQFDMGSLNDGGYGFGANSDNFFNADNIDGNYVDDTFFSSNNYGN